MNRTVVTLCVICAVVDAAVGAVAQESRLPVFEVVSIKPFKIGQGPFRASNAPDGSLTLTGPTQILIAQAYPGVMGEIEGLPVWARTEMYEVVAKPSAGVSNPTSDQRAAMIRGLLADRYKMVAHVETREGPAFTLTVARSDGRLGPGLQRSNTVCVALPAPVPLDGQVPPCRTGMSGNRFEGETTVAAFAVTLRALLGRPVIDKTGLTGIYRISFESSTQPFTGAVVEGLPSAATALREQLGLRLETTRAPIEVLVIDRLERPSEN
jgi:uncharacterized protein (TIGR03435 family)